MKRYAVFTARLALVPMLSGPFVASTTGGESIFEWAHIISGFAAIYLIIGLMLISAKNRDIRLSVIVAVLGGLLEAVPGMPRLHAAVSPVLFAALAWAAFTLPSERKTQLGSRWVFVLPALLLPAIYYGVGYRHQTSGFLPHIGVALVVAGSLLVFCAVMNERHPANSILLRANKLMMAALLGQVVFGIAAFAIRLVEAENGLWLALARAAHITGAALLLAAVTEFSIQYRRNVV